MKDYLNNLPNEIQDLIHLAGDIAAKNSMSCYLVGGFVRDLILGIKNLDLDIVVEGDGIRFAEVLSEAQKAEVIRHRRFGTATVMLESNLKIDITTARKEYYPQAAHLPLVTFGTLKDDLARRDFTVNAMAINISRGYFGKFIDFFGGKDDLRHKKIRVLHSLSFIDDPTRILRAIRFEQRYNFKIEPKTLKLLREAARLKMLEKVQPQRLRDELIPILKESRPIKDVRRIKELSGFSFLSHGLLTSKNTIALLNSIERQVSWFRKNYPKCRHLDAWLIYFMGLIEPLNINKIKLICKIFAFRKGEQKRILAYKKINSKIVKELNRDKIKPAKIFNLLEPLSYEVILLIKAKYEKRIIKKHIEVFFRHYHGRRLYISGEDLHSLGLAPGPHYHKILRRVLNAKLNGLVETEKEELELIKKIIRWP